MAKGYRVLSHGSKRTKGSPFRSKSEGRSQRQLRRYLAKLERLNKK